MRSSAALLIGVTLAFLATVLLPRPAQAEVRVTFINSFYYSDLAETPPDKRESMLSEIRKAFVDIGAPFLKPEQVLKIEILKIDRIPTSSSSSSPAPAHSKSEEQPMRMEIQYALQQNGKTLSQSRDSLSDVNYLSNPIPPDAKKDALSHVKEMIHDWFEETFGASTF